VLVDGSAHSDAAFDAAVALKKPDHALLLVHSVNLVRPWTAGPHAGPYLDPQTLTKTNDALIHNSKHMIHKYTRWAQQLKVPVQAFVITSDENPKDAALHFAREQHASLIVVGSRGLGGIQRLLVGSFSSHVVQNAQCDVLVARRDAHKPREATKEVVGTATRAELSKIVTTEQIGAIQPHAVASPGHSRTVEEGLAERHNRIRKQLEVKQTEIRALLDELGSDENQREAALRLAMSENAENAKRREMDAARSNQQLLDLRKARDDLLLQIREKEKETEKLRAEKERALQELKQKQAETDQRTREKEEAVAQVRKRVEVAETERVELARVLKRAEEKNEKERQKRDTELSQLQSQTKALQSETAHEKAAREQALREKEAEMARERKEHDAQRAKLEKDIKAKGNQIADEQKREQQLRKEIEAQHQHAVDLEAETKSLHDEIDHVKRSHNADIDRLTHESETKLEHIRTELHAELSREQHRLQEVIKLKEAELATERAKRKETEMLRAKDEESRIGEKAHASRVLREEMERTETEAQERLKEQRERAHQAAQEMRQAESDAARLAPQRDASGRHHASMHSHSSLQSAHQQQQTYYPPQTSTGPQRVTTERTTHSATTESAHTSASTNAEEEHSATGFAPDGSDANKRCLAM